MDIQHIQEIVNLVANSQLAEVEIKLYGDSIRIRNSQQPRLPSSDNQLEAASEITNLKPNQAQQESGSMSMIQSKNIGWLKLAEDGISEPLVKIGDKVQEGDTLAYVAYMAQLLPITADKTGYISDILLEDNTKVEYGTPIFHIIL